MLHLPYLKCYVFFLGKFHSKSWPFQNNHISICFIWSVMYPQFFLGKFNSKSWPFQNKTMFQFALSKVYPPIFGCLSSLCKMRKKGESLRLILKVNFKNLFGFVGRLGDKLFCWALACWISLFIWRLASLKEINNLIRHQPTRSHRTTFLNIHNQIYLEQTKTFLSKKIF